MVFGRKPKEERPPVDDAGIGHPDAALLDEHGLYPLWYLEKRLREELARAARVSGVFSLACWSLKVLSDESLNDEQVRKAAELISGGLRAYDVYARIDEQRFIAVLFDAEYQAASTVAFRIKSDMQVQIQSGGRWQASVSTFPRDGMDGDSLIQTAFRRLQGDSRAA